MKKKIILWTVTLTAALAAYSVIPGMVQSGIPAIYYITPSVKTYENVVNCTGVIQSENIYEIRASSALVPGYVSASVGDMVDKGDILLTVDEAATQKLSSNTVGGVIDGITDEARGVASTFDIEALLSAFGLTGMLGGYDLSGITEAVSGDSSSTDGVTSISAGQDIGEILSPVSGIVTEAGVVTGSAVSMGKLLFTVQDINHYKVIASVSEADISKIQIGDTAIIRGDGFASTSFKGEVSKIYPTARKALSGSGTDTVVDVEIRILSPNSKLRHGFSAKVEISGGQSYRLVTVPYEAVRQDGRNMEYVYTYENGKLQKTPIITGKELVNEVEVLEGLTFDSIVIYNPDDVTGEGSIVNIKGRADFD